MKSCDAGAGSDLKRLSSLAVFWVFVTYGLE